MRWWLALVFAALVASTALFVAEVMTRRSEAAFRNEARDLAAGKADSAAYKIRLGLTHGRLSAVVARVAHEEGIAVFLFDFAGEPISPKRSQGVDLSSVKNVQRLVLPALHGQREIQTRDNGKRIVIGAPLGSSVSAVLVAVVSQPDLVKAGQIVHGKVIGAVFLAIAFGALIGIAVAFAITSRLRRIARAASAIGAGDFDLELSARFPDELGQLAEATDAMRRQLSESFVSLEGERRRLEQLLEQLQEGVLAVDSELLVVYANARAGQLLETQSPVGAERLPDPWVELSLGELAKKLFEPGASVVRKRVSPAPEKTFSVAGIPARAGIAVLVISDVSLAERRERAEREFVANAAHELRTPLSAISGAAEALASGAGEQPADRDRFVAIIARQTERLGRLVQALLALARAQTGSEQLQLEPVELRPLLEEVAGEASASGTKIDLDCPYELSVIAHRDLLRQAIENLISNAAKYGGRELEIGAEPLPSGCVRIEVGDHGGGLDPEQRERAFDRFFRAGKRDGEGFGLGLSIVREVVSALAGKLEIDSAPGRGTRVAIVLPSATTKVQPK